MYNKVYISVVNLYKSVLVMLSAKSEQLLNEIYYNVNHPAGFSNTSRLYGYAVKEKGLRFQDVGEF